MAKPQEGSNNNVEQGFCEISHSDIWQVEVTWSGKKRVITPLESESEYQKVKVYNFKSESQD